MNRTFDLLLGVTLLITGVLLCVSGMHHWWDWPCLVWDGLFGGFFLGRGISE